MPYSSEYREERYEDIRNSIEKLEKLKEGEVLVISASSPKEQGHFYWLLRDYFHVTGLSAIYKCSKIGPNLFIGKKLTSDSRFIRTVKSSLPYKYDKLIGTLISSPKPRELLCTYIKDKDYSLSLLSIVLEELSRVLEE